MSDPFDPNSGAVPPPPPPGGGGAVPPPVDPYAQPAPPAPGFPTTPPPPPGAAQDPYQQPAYQQPAYEQQPAGYPQAGYPQAGYQAYGTGPTGPDATASFSWGWKKFQEHLGAIAIAIGVWFAATLVLGGLGVLLFLAIGRSSTGIVIASVAVAVLMLMLWAAMYIGQYGIIRASLGISQGRAPTTAEMFNMDNFVPFLLTSLLVAVIQAIGYALCYVPGLVAMFFLLFAPAYSADKGMGAVDAVKASVDAVQKNIGPVAIFFLLSLVAYAIGAVLCGIGILVAVPVIILASGHMYRAVNGEPIAP